MRMPTKFAARIRPGGGPRRDSGRLLGDELLTTDEAAEHLRMSTETLKYWRHRRIRRGPRFFKLHAHLVVYRLADLESFLRSRAVSPMGKGIAVR